MNNCEYEIKEVTQEELQKEIADEEELCDISANSHDIIHKIVEDYFKNNKE